MKKPFVATIGVVPFCGAPALAANMAMKSMPPAPVAVAPSWTGIYVGGDVFEYFITALLAAGHSRWEFLPPHHMTRSALVRF